jgi:hypothetical protein
MYTTIIGEWFYYPFTGEWYRYIDTVDYYGNLVERIAERC